MTRIAPISKLISEVSQEIFRFDPACVVVVGDTALVGFAELATGAFVVVVAAAVGVTVAVVVVAY